MSQPDRGRDEAALLDIVTAARRIADYLDGMDARAFLGDLRTQDAVVRRLEIIGEAANRVSEACRAAEAGVPWSGLIGLRNVLAHQYDRVDYAIVWQIAKESIPLVLAHLESRFGQPSG